MSDDTTLRLLIIDESLNDADAYVSALRSDGLSLREHILKTDEDCEEIIESHSPDLILISYTNSTLPAKNMRTMLESKTTPTLIILTCKDPDDISIHDALNLGMRDKVIKSDTDLLCQIVKRELEYLQALKSKLNLEKRYAESESRCKVLMENSRDAIAYVFQGMHVYANTAYMEMFGFENFDDIEGLPIMDMVAPEKQEAFKQFLRSLDTTDGKITELKTQLNGQDSQVFTGLIEFRGATIEGEPCTQILIRQQADTKALEEQINQLSRLDPLTGILNRQAFLEEFDTAIKNIAKNNRHYTLFQIGIDDFKNIQDTVGLVGSDQVISEGAVIIKNQLSENDLAGRYDGSKYLMLAKGTDTKTITTKAKAMVSAFEEHVCDIAGKSINIKCHIGISVIDDATLDVNEVMSRADKALVAAYENDDESFNIYRPKEGEMTQKQIDTAWVKRLKESMDQNRFQLLYQPIVQLDDSTMERYEVFMEMQDENGERVPAHEFMPAAERTKMSKILDRWVINNALEQMIKRTKTNPNTIFFIKLSGGSLEDMELFRSISDKVKSCDIEKWRIIFEVKEEAVISHLKQAQAFATLLKTIHCNFAIDDFGKGPDPFKLLEIIPAQYLKFHKDFTQDLSSNQENQKTLQEITEKASSLKKHTIVQHIEDAATLSVLWTIGANYTQGNFFQGPSQKIDYDFSSGIG